MERIMFRSKIHRAIVTQGNKNYPGSITIDEDLMEAANIAKFEQVQVLSITKGARLITYVIPGKRGSGTICVNGAAANLIKKGEIIIIVAYCNVPERKVKKVNPRVVLVNKKNKIVKVIDGHEHVLNSYK